ncbi:hypothetical protein ASC94_23315 [Massilia sp. Root418]|nr:hypothetical protein ASC94_23315 [Massilia sp. Root418]
MARILGQIFNVRGKDFVHVAGVLQFADVNPCDCDFAGACAEAFDLNQYSLPGDLLVIADNELCQFAEHGEGHAALRALLPLAIYHRALQGDALGAFLIFLLLLEASLLSFLLLSQGWRLRRGRQPLPRGMPHGPPASRKCLAFQMPLGHHYA